jgi:hypothetical protein
MQVQRRRTDKDPDRCITSQFCFLGRLAFVVRTLDKTVWTITTQQNWYRNFVWQVWTYVSSPWLTCDSQLSFLKMSFKTPTPVCCNIKRVCHIQWAHQKSSITAHYRRQKLKDLLSSDQKQLQIEQLFYFWVLLWRQVHLVQRKTNLSLAEAIRLTKLKSSNKGVQT